MEKKRILIYGDSNTHGFRIEDGLRFGSEIRWTGVCQHMLGDEYEILNEGLNGRTTCHDEWGMEFRNGLKYIEPCIRTHLPLDVVCVMLGSNDLKAEFGQTAEQIAENGAKVLEKAREVVKSKYPESSCKYVLMAPVRITEDVINGPFGWDFQGMRAVEESLKFAECFRQQAEAYGFEFFNAAEFAEPGKIDGLHLDVENHRKLGTAFYEFIKELRY